MATKPTHEQAQLNLQLYEERREARLRQARDWFFRNYFVDNMDDAMRIAAFGTEAGTFVMMVLGYWEQACALLNYGLLHETCSLRPAENFSVSGSALNPRSRRVVSASRISYSLLTWKKPPTGMKRGPKLARPAISPPCARWANRCASRCKRRLNPGFQIVSYSRELRNRRGRSYSPRR